MSWQVLDSSRGLGMTGKGVEWWKAGVSGWQGVGLPRSTPCLRKGRLFDSAQGERPHQGMDSRSGSGMMG